MSNNMSSKCIYPRIASRIKSVYDLGKRSGLCGRSLLNKLTGKRDWRLNEMKAVRDAIAPESTLDYLFATEEEVQFDENA